MFANRVKQIAPSPTLALGAKVRAMRAQGKDVISFAMGEPDFPTPEPICEEAIRAIREGFTHYTDSRGTLELREEISRKLLEENHIHASPDQIVVSCGAKHALFNALMAICNPGDEVILLAPCWMTYREQAILAGAVPVVVETPAQNQYLPVFEDIQRAITPRTKAIIINSPCNPTGAVFPRNTLKEIASLALRHGFFIISDEIYEKHIYDGNSHTSIASLSQEVAKQTITINGVSKSFAMTGWRIGYASAPLDIAEAMATIQDQVTSNPSGISQKAALAALRLDSKLIHKMLQDFDSRRCFMAEELASVSGAKFCLPKGAFYIFAEFDGAIGNKIKNDIELVNYLLENYEVACIPGSVFEGPGKLRLTYALPHEQIREGIQRLSEGIRSLN
ncbi:MAG TPA: pyridoxal phosphate-dependent aminotransferase [Fimbriimonadales bacterium]|nr:pyridoxal phosphate-dependent aminotransferase [Fimbriimonadales bacterium]